MRLLTMVVLLLVSSSAFAEPSAVLKNVPLENPLMIRILTDSEQRDIGALSLMRIPTHVVRLYSVSNEGDCIPGTRMPCSFNYFLALATLEEASKKKAYYLGEIGELVRVERAPDTGECQEHYIFHTSNYPEYVFVEIPELVGITARYDICISQAKLVVKALE